MDKVIEQAAQTLAACMDYPWEHMPEQGRENMRKHARRIVAPLRAYLRQVAQAHAWLAFGECRSFGDDVALLSSSDADAVARVALGEFREPPNVGGERQ